MSRAAQYARLFTKAGRIASFERPVVNGTALTADNIRVRLRGATPYEIAGGIKATERKILVLAADIPPAFHPLRQNDRIILDGLRLTITSRPDDNSHRDGNILLAYEGVVSGG